MKVVILAGGRGVRYDADKSKMMAMIGNKPILHHLMDIYSSQGYNDFVLCLGWRQEDIIKYFLKAVHNYTITFVDTYQDSHTAKRLKLIENHIPKEDKEFLCTYGDGLANVDLMKLYTRHITNKNIATLTAVKPNSQFGLLVFDENENIIRLEEKSKMSQYINGGFFIFNKRIFDYIDINKNQELEKDILSNLAFSNELGSYKHKGFWETLNTPKDEINLNNINIECTKQGKQSIWLRI